MRRWRIDANCQGYINHLMQFSEMFRNIEKLKNKKFIVGKNPQGNGWLIKEIGGTHKVAQFGMDEAVPNSVSRLMALDNGKWTAHYSLDIDGDGQVIAFSKEIKAKEVVGSLVGKCLSDALVERGWTRPERIVLLNDTTAALQAGAASAAPGVKYSSYVGLILGTGMNAAYIESGKIAKIAESAVPVPPSQIVVCESGMFDKLPRSAFDVAFDQTTNTPGKYVMEKMCSGAYLGPVATLALKSAAHEGLFSAPVTEALAALPKAELFDMDRFFYGPYRTDTVLGRVIMDGTEEDYDTMYTILDAVVERSARLTASIIAACVIKSGAGTSPTRPVCVLCNGTTFYKTHNLQQRLRGYLNTVLTEQRHLYFELVSVENDITLGTAIAALSQ